MGGSNDGETRRLLAHLPQFADVAGETLRELEAICRVRSYASGQVVAAPEEEAGFIGFVLEGILRMQKSLQDGRHHIVGLMVEGDMFGRVFDGPLTFGIEAATDAVVCAFQRKAFEALILRSPDLERVVLLNILNELDRARDWMIILANPRVKGRLAGFLLVLCTRFAGIDHLLQREGSSIEVKVPISRADLADLLGTRPESISRAFHALADAGCIGIIRPDLIEIRDIEALGAEAGEEDLVSQADLENIVEDLQRRSD